MTSAPIRDLLADHLLTPQNAAFLFIDYQPAQLATIRSMDLALLMNNAISTVKTIKTFGVLRSVRALQADALPCPSASGTAAARPAARDRPLGRDMEVRRSGS